ncbi:hypothetical protein [Aidingimonas halophila]|uniref:Uncharacterized protein n=1 Tax=Aidingimonas halophila TaxID=574349 RepID=A0A1H3E705_9GAMM|nr:hypothetical protein [Aidingimonas halophila]GHC33973.1 hypothetical protein GCM10008094_28620 [Aidingimonas halophila]SDX74523.1 hypothetical protein SAMN05443545_10730 [Aidingimonas halophila]
MRDLYQRLGIDRQAGTDDIRQAIDACDHNALKTDASTVLEVPSRREEYDRLHATLTDIGCLRARLGLTHGPYWRDSVANDFSLPPDTSRPLHEVLLSRIGEAVMLHNRWRRYRGPWLIGGIFVLGFLMGAALCHWWL